MTSQAKRTAGMWLVGAAIALAAIAFLLWQRASDAAETDRLEAGYASAISGEVVEADDADRTPSLAVAGLAAVSLLSGVIFLATARPGDDD